MRDKCNINETLGIDRLSGYRLAAGGTAELGRRPGFVALVDHKAELFRLAEIPDPAAVRERLHQEVYCHERGLGARQGPCNRVAIGVEFSDNRCRPAVNAYPGRLAIDKQFELGRIVKDGALIQPHSIKIVEDHVDITKRIKCRVGQTGTIIRLCKICCREPQRCT